MALDSLRARFAPAIRQSLASQLQVVEVEPLRTAMRHLAGGGKLVRPLLVLATAEAVSGQDADDFVDIAAALELVHLFSLIHDDLPALDDARLRRGVPAVHVEHGEAVALLAGTGMMCLAIGSLLRESAGLTPRARLELAAAVTSAIQRMIEGEALDLQGESRQLPAAEIERMYTLKTGALLGACCEAGALLAGAGSDLRLALRGLGEQLGFTFQIRDDLLDAESTEEQFGKPVGADAARGKSTLVGLCGADAARDRLAEVLAGAAARIEQLPLKDKAPLLELTRWLGQRQS